MDWKWVRFAIRAKWRGILLHLALFFGVGLIVTTVALYGSLAVHLLYWLNPWCARIAVVMAAVSIGQGMEKVKTRAQYVYGVIELSFGTWSAYLIAKTLTPHHMQLTQTLSLVGCCYVISSAYRNLREVGEYSEAEWARVYKQYLQTLPEEVLAPEISGVWRKLNTSPNRPRD
jgi:hypothetical protein